jgi:signal transduction histidine kinase
MRRLRDLSIKRKLTAVSFVTSAATLVLVGVAFGALAIRSYRQALVTQISTQAEIIGFNSTSALMFADERSAGETLSALRAEPRVAFAAIYTPDGRPFATYVRADLAKERLPELLHPPRAEALGFRGGHFDLVRRVGGAASPLGSVYIRADLTELRERVLQYAGITAVVLTVSLVAALGIASALQKMISEPVLELVRTARVVAFEKNYNVRASTQSRDELGVLVGAFNEMLEQIQRRDAELRSVNRRLGQRTDELARKNEEVEAFVYIVSHDLRGPLVNLQGFSQELQRSCNALLARLPGLPGSSDEVREIAAEQIPGSLRFIAASTSKFERLINALLQLSRSGRQEYRSEPLDVDAIVRTTLDSLRSSVDESGAEVTVAPLPNARGDATAVGQIFSNLIVNAVNYLQPGRPGRIEIGGERDGTASHYWVKDNGVGIPESARPRLFQVFQRFHPTVPGEGMGLATIKRIVERHAGRVWAESAEGVGTTIHWTLRADGPDQE